MTSHPTEDIARGRDDVAAIERRLASARKNSWQRRAAVTADAIEARLSEVPPCVS
jgi:hypothetical protein